MDNKEMIAKAGKAIARRLDLHGAYVIKGKVYEEVNEAASLAITATGLVEEVESWKQQVDTLVREDVRREELDGLGLSRTFEYNVTMIRNHTLKERVKELEVLCRRACSSLSGLGEGHVDIYWALDKAINNNGEEQ